MNVFFCSVETLGCLDYLCGRVIRFGEIGWFYVTWSVTIILLCAHRVAVCRFLVDLGSVLVV